MPRPTCNTCTLLAAVRSAFWLRTGMQGCGTRAHSIVRYAAAEVIQASEKGARGSHATEVPCTRQDFMDQVLSEVCSPYLMGPRPLPAAPLAPRRTPLQRVQGEGAWAAAPCLVTARSHHRPRSGHSIQIHCRSRPPRLTQGEAGFSAGRSPRCRWHHGWRPGACPQADAAAGGPIVHQHAASWAVTVGGCGASRPGGLQRQQGHRHGGGSGSASKGYKGSTGRPTAASCAIGWSKWPPPLACHAHHAPGAPTAPATAAPIERCHRRCCRGPLVFQRFPWRTPPSSQPSLLPSQAPHPMLPSRHRPARLRRPCRCLPPAPPRCAARG